MLRFLRNVLDRWLEVDAFSLAAALAYYAIFSIAPLLLLSIHLASLFLDRTTAVEALTNELISVIGPAGSDAINTVRNGSDVFNSECTRASDFSLSNAKTNWIQMGCSGQSVPSLSNTAMRSLAGTKSGVASVVTRLTKSTKRAFAAHSFQEESGSVGTYFKSTNRSLSSIL
jgi:hypothetical protein